MCGGALTCGSYSHVERHAGGFHMGKFMCGGALTWSYSHVESFSHVVEVHVWRGD